MRKERTRTGGAKRGARSWDKMERRSWNSWRRFHEGGSGSVATVELARLKS